MNDYIGKNIQYFPMKLCDNHLWSNYKQSRYCTYCGSCETLEEDNRILELDQEISKHLKIISSQLLEKYRLFPTLLISTLSEMYSEFRVDGVNDMDDWNDCKKICQFPEQFPLPHECKQIISYGDILFRVKWNLFSCQITIRTNSILIYRDGKLMNDDQVPEISYSLNDGVCLLIQFHRDIPDIF